MRISAFLLLLFAASLACAKVSVGEQPPDRIGKDREGQEVTISGLHGKVVIVTFWASWCSPCRQELPVLDSLQRLVGRDALEVVAVNFKEDRRLYRKLLRELDGIALTMVHDGRGRTSDAYDVSVLPNMFVIDHEGRVAHVHRGYSADMLDGFIAEINTLLRARADALGTDGGRAVPAQGATSSP